MSDLGLCIRKKLREQHISASALEKKAGIRPSTLQNILQGRSKNPSLEILKAAASALGCTISELVGENSVPLESVILVDEWVPEIYVQAVWLIGEACRKRKISFSRSSFFKAVRQIYTYALRYKKTKIDQDFADWVVTQIQEEEGKNGELS